MNQICKVCKIEKSLHDDFYANSNKSGRDTTCKICRYQQKLDRQKTSQPHKHNRHEQDFITACHEHGIYAIQATLANHKFCDAVAWGCVRIEVKYPDIANDGNMYYWRFTRNQARKRLPVDIIVLVTEHLGETKYHFFNPLHPVFFKPDQTRKVGISYTVERQVDYNPINGVVMTHDILNMHKDAWHTIENMRLEKAKRLKHQAVTKKRNAA
jgi:hypothetical protein